LDGQLLDEFEIRAILQGLAVPDASPSGSRIASVSDREQRR